MKRPVYFIAQKAGVKYSARAESIFCRTTLPFGTVISDIPEQPKNMRELIALRQSGYIVEHLRDINHA